MQRKSYFSPSFLPGVLMALALLLPYSFAGATEDPREPETLRSSNTVIGLCPSAQFADCSAKLQGAAENRASEQVKKLCENKGGILESEPSCASSCNPAEPPANKPVSSVNCSTECQAPCRPL